MATAPATAPRRTAAIVILAVVAVLAGISAVLDTLRLLGWLPTQMTTLMGEIEFYNQNFFGAILSGLVALIWFATAGQLWRLDPRGWLFVAAISTLNIIFLLLAWLGASSFQSIVWGLVLSAVALILALLPSTKAAFGMQNPPPTAARK
jgi:hypothetical protein